MTWLELPDDTPFGLDNLPYGVLVDGRIVVAIGDFALDTTPFRSLGTDSLSALMARGPAAWARVREQLTELLTSSAHADRVRPHLLPRKEIHLLLPFDVADYVDFYASEQHATNLGRLLRPGEDPLTPNWKHMPIAYHGRAGTVVVSGTPIRRPHGQLKSSDAVTFGPSRRLDFEVELGFVIGTPSELGTPVDIETAADHLFGVCLVNDWSARDLQGWEYQPLGPFLAKSFATSVSPWVVPMAALEAARIPLLRQDPPPLPYLTGESASGLDIDFEVGVNGTTLSRPSYRSMYWSPEQMVAHLTANGATLRTGDLLASGTISGPAAHDCGSLMELSWAGQRPVALDDGTTRTFLEDGDVVGIAATAAGGVCLDEVTGRIMR